MAKIQIFSLILWSKNKHTNNDTEEFNSKTADFMPGNLSP